MRVNARSLMLLIVGSIALSCTACSSNNAGKIIGKWKILSAPGLDSNLVKQMESMKIYTFIEFKADNGLIIGAESSDPKLQGELAKSGQAMTKSCKYKLKGGDVVEFYDMPKDMQEKGGGGLFGGKDRARTRIKINGDDMTMIDDDGKNASLVRVK